MWPGSSRDTRTFPSLVFKLYIEQILSKPPHATKLPDGAYAHVMTHDERNGMACTYKRGYGRENTMKILCRLTVSV